MKEKERCWYASAIDIDHVIIIVQWVYNTVVVVGSTCYGVNPIVHVKTRNQANKKKMFKFLVNKLLENIIRKYQRDSFDGRRHLYL